MYFKSSLNFVETVPLQTALLEIRSVSIGVVQAFPHSQEDVGPIFDELYTKKC